MKRNVVLLPNGAKVIITEKSNKNNLAMFQDAAKRLTK